VRILHVISTLAPASGGPTHVLRGLASAQADAGHEVTLCTTDRDNPVRHKLPTSYFETFCSDQVILKVFRVIYGPLLLSPGMAQWLRKNLSKFDVTHIHGLYRFPPTYAAYEARKQAVPFVIRPHGSLDPYVYAKSSASLRLKRAYERWFDIPNLNAASAIHYTAEDERQRASFLALRASSFMVPNAVDWRHYERLPSRGRLRARLGLGQTPMILFLGRLHFKKGLDLLVPAFDALRRTVPEAHLVIAGPENDAYGLTVRAWVRERGLGNVVHFVGSLDGPDVVQAYVDADVFALPSYTENFGMAVVEAMACGVPVVISDQVNIHSHVTEVGAGCVTRCDSQELTQALNAMLQYRDGLREMGRAGRRLVQERFTWPAIVEKLTKEYQRVLESHCASQQVMREARGIGCQ